MSSLAALLAVATTYAPAIPPARSDAARPLPLGAVRLTGGPLKRAQDVAEEALPGAGTFRLLDVDYPLPDRLVAGRQRVTVRFQATEGREVAPVFGIRSLRSAPSP